MSQLHPLRHSHIYQSEWSFQTLYLLSGLICDSLIYTPGYLVILTNHKWENKRERIEKLEHIQEHVWLFSMCHWKEVLYANENSEWKEKTHLSFDENTFWIEKIKLKFWIFRLSKAIYLDNFVNRISTPI